VGNQLAPGIGIKAAGDPLCEHPLRGPACDDWFDNDSDGFQNFPADPECASAFDTNEAKPGDQSCGIGFELALVVPLLMWLRKRRWRTA
jgi:hypothetical protein